MDLEDAIATVFCHPSFFPLVIGLTLALFIIGQQTPTKATTEAALKKSSAEDVKQNRIDELANQMLVLLEGRGGMADIEAIKKKVDDEDEWNKITEIVQIRLGRKP